MPLPDRSGDGQSAAAANPLLSPDRVSALLAVPDTAEGAAANPILPAERLHELLTARGLT